MTLTLEEKDMKKVKFSSLSEGDFFRNVSDNYICIKVTTYFDWCEDSFDAICLTGEYIGSYEGPEDDELVIPLSVKITEI